VFSFHPHASRFKTTPGDLVSLPSEVENTDGVLFPNLETAATLAMDGSPGLGDRVVIFGQGVVGLLTTGLMATYPLEGVYTVEPSSARRELSSAWGADQIFAPADQDDLRSALNITSADTVEAWEGDYEGADLVYELSGNPSVLSDALSVAGYDGRVVIGSWYGEKTSSVELGGRFHRSRVQVKSSQVSSIDPDFRGRWSKNRRTQLVLRLLNSLRPGQLITDEYPLEEAPTVYDRLSEGDESLIQPVFCY
jgi:threonine dehydrogenase-like Zn-dependent dehydrogenase